MLNNKEINFNVDTGVSGKLSPAVSLWMAVISQAMKDSIKFDTRAMKWLESKYEDTTRVFDFAGLDQQRAVKNMKKIVVYIAKSTARGSRPKLNRDKVEWSKPSKLEKDRAARFILSNIGQRYIFEVDPEALKSAKDDAEKLLLLMGND